MTEHTPGPWKLNLVCMGSPTYNKPCDAGFEVIADVEGYAEPRVLAMSIMQQADDPTGWLATDEANLRLMAAAPKMLAVLQQGVLRYKNWDKEALIANLVDSYSALDVAFILAARSVIAKATGSK